MKRFFAILLHFLARFLDDILILAGCACILYGLSLWNVVVTWIVAGLILIGLAYLIGKARSNHVI
jgi:hypothetical protein